MALERNILVILGSGHRADAYGAAGVWPILTPHLDELAANGLELVCTAPSPAHRPALISLYSGLHPRQHGLIDDGFPLPTVTGWPAMCREDGCHMAGVGRVGSIAALLHRAHVVCDVDQTDDPQCQYLDFATRQSFLAQVQNDRRSRARNGPFGIAAPAQHNPDHDIDGFIATEAVAMIELLPHDQPWVLTVALTGPGNHLPAPQHYYDMVDVPSLHDPFEPPDLPALDAYIELDVPRTRIQTLQPDVLAEIRAHYMARVMQLDQTVGALRDAVDRHGHAPNTWIVYAADHGMLMGERGLIGHRSFLANAVYVPLWILPPRGVERDDDEGDTDRQANGLLSAACVAPTLCAIAGVDPPAGAAEPSVLPALCGHPTGGDAVISEHGDRLMLETLRYKAVFNTQSAVPLALFDLVKDPDERHDIINASLSANVLDMLRWQLAQSLMPLRGGAMAMV